MLLLPAVEVLERFNAKIDLMHEREAEMQAILAEKAAAAEEDAADQHTASASNRW